MAGSTKSIVQMAPIAVSPQSGMRSSKSNVHVGCKPSLGIHAMQVSRYAGCQPGSGLDKQLMLSVAEL